MMKDRTYRTWIYMRQRCLNPNNNAWKDYGGRGITICDRWDSFANFLADMGERPAGTSLDRIDNEGNYEPDNVKWSTPAEQAHNTRTNLRVTAFGETKVAGEWVRDPRCAVSSTSLRRRLKSGGLSPEEAISKPSRQR